VKRLASSVLGVRRVLLLPIHGLEILLSIVVPLALVASLVATRNQATIGLGAPSESSAVAGLTPDQLTTGASRLIADATAHGGGGYRFEIVQRATLRARPGGPQVPIADPSNPEASPIGLADDVYQAGLVETGVATPGGFSMTMRLGPASPEARPDLAAGRVLFQALVRDGNTFRNDGQGWYATDQPPGIGLDPRTAQLLPQFLTRSQNRAEIPLDAVSSELGSTDDRTTRAITLQANLADIPGIVAVDGEEFTELTGPVTATFDSTGRLSGLVVSARNTNMQTFDLTVVTEIAFRYDDVPAGLPDPLPAYKPTPAPAEETKP
jgi:hypothetical protein